MAKNKTLKSGHIANTHIGRRQLINLAIILLLLYAVLPRLDKFKTSFDAIRHGQLAWALAALGFAIATSFVASIVIMILAKKRLRYVRTLIVQFASLFANRLLPGGIGSIGVNFEYLRRNRHSKEAAGAVLATITLLGFIGHLLLLSAVLLITKTRLIGTINLHINGLLYWLFLLAILCLIIVVFWLKKLRSEVTRTALGTFKNLASYRTHPLKLLAALVSSMGLTSLYSLCLLASAESVGIHLAFGQILVVLTVGVAASTITPTPGGLIGAEAGLFAGLVAYGANSAEALAAVLVYRFLTYWLPLVFGAFVWEIVIRGDYI